LTPLSRIFTWGDNFDSLANVDDGSCVRLGCMTDWADNYDDLANIDSGDCYKEGCMVDYMDNYDELAIQDSSGGDVCVREGCTSDLYFEYDALANSDLSGLNCVTLIIDGCYNPIAENYNPDANNGNQEDLCEINQVDPSSAIVTSNNMSVLFPVENTSIWDENSDIQDADIIFAVHEISRLDVEVINYSAINAIASAGFGTWNGENLGIPVFGADGNENNGYYEGEPLVWLIAHETKFHHYMLQ
jgi:hypothetical protein